MFAMMDTDVQLSIMVTVYDQVPEDAPHPYIKIGDHLSVPDNDHGGFGRESTVTVHVWTRSRGNAQGQAIANRVIELFDHRPSDVDVQGHLVVSIRCEFDQALPDPNPEIRHHVVRFRIVTAQHNDGEES